MSKKNDCWGIEVGSNAIKAVRLVRNGDTVQVMDFDVLPFKQVLTMPDVNVDEAIQLNLDQFLSRRSVSYSTVVVSVPGNSALVRFAKLPPVEPKRIPDIVKFEAVQQIPFPIDQVEWDYQIFSKPDSPDVEVGIFAIVRERLNQYLANYRAVGMRVDAVTISPLAVYNAFAYDMQLTEDSPGIIFMDIGTTSTDLIIAEGGNIWPRTLPRGGNNFTEALVRSFKLSFPKAEKLKREAGTSKYARQIFQAMRPVFSELVQEMQRSLGFYQSMNRETNLTKIVGVGSTFRLPGMQKFLKQQLQMEVERPDGFERVKIEGKLEAEFDEQAINLTTAYGLALQGLGLARIEANVMPRAVLKQRIWRAKQPWMAASAALFVFASGAAYTTEFSVQKAYEEAKGTSKNYADGVVKKANGLIKDWTDIQSSGEDPRAKINSLERLLDYRNTWPYVVLDVEQAAKSLDPQPALLVADYADIKKIVRGDRRRIYIHSITSIYRSPVPNNTDTGLGGLDTVGGQTSDQIFNATPPPAPAAAQNPGAPPPMYPPRFDITIEGDTSVRNPIEFLDHFQRWFGDPNNLHNRPYIVVPGSVQVGRISQPYKLLVPPPNADSSWTPQPAPQPDDVPNPFGVDQNAPVTPLIDVLPLRPLATEQRNLDSHFVLYYTIQLLKPDDARQQEKGPETSPPANKTAADSSANSENRP